MINYKINDASVFSVEMPLDEKIIKEMESWLKPSQSNYGTKRKHDFLAGRYCAKKALEKLSISIMDIGMHESRAPVWPRNIVGSITHTKSIAIAAVSNKLQSMGIDAENIMDIKRYQSLKKMIVSSNEEVLINHDLKNYPTLFFSAKESLYKTIYPLCEQYFGFLDASIISIGSNEFTIELHSTEEKVSKFNKTYAGKYKIFNDLIVTSITV